MMNVRVSCGAFVVAAAYVRHRRDGQRNEVQRFFDAMDDEKALQLGSLDAVFELGY
jgi:hypothetical protein